MIHLIDIHGRNAQGQADVLRRATGRGYRTRPSETPANAKWLPGVAVPYHLTRSLLCQDTQTSRSDAGEIVILNNKGELDPLKDWFFDGRSVQTWYGSERGLFSGFSPMFKGVIKDVEFTSRQISYLIRSRQEELAKALGILPKYQGANSGTTGIEGEASLKDKYKPLCLGYAKNVPGMLANAAAGIWQVHFRSVQDIPAARSNGAALTKGADYADEVALKNASISAGYYATCLAKGLARVPSTLGTVITFDVKGDNVGGYVETVAGCLQRLLEMAGWVSGVDFDPVSLAALAAQVTGPVAIYDDAGSNVAALLDRIAASAWAWWSPDRSGLTRFGRIAAPDGTPALVIKGDKLIDLEQITHELAGMPWSLVSMDYDHNYRVQSGTELASGVSAAMQTWLAEAARTLTSTEGGQPDPAVLALHPFASQAAFTSRFTASADAQAEVTRRALYRAAMPRAFRFRLDFDLAMALDLGLSLRIQTNRMGLSNWLGRVVSMEEVPESKYTEVVACG